MKKIFFTIVIFFIFTSPAFANGLTNLMVNTFSPNGKGAAISTIIALAIGTWILEQVTGIIGKNNYGNWIKLSGMFLALSVFVATAIAVLSKILSIVFP